MAFSSLEGYQQKGRGE